MVSTRNIALTSIYPSRQLEIAGQKYLLEIFPQGNSAPYTWRFQLENKLISGLIPGGFKLRVLRSATESFPENEAVATQAVVKLWVDVCINSGSAITWEIEPIPEGYQREILIF